MTTVTWAQLTPGQQALLDKLARAGGEWVQTPATLDEISQREYGELLDTHKFIEWNPLNTRATWLGERITAAGIAVWQQGQAASAPRSVWVAEHYEYNQGDSVLAIHATAGGAKAHCEASTENALTWYETELTEGKSYTGLCGKNGETFHVYEMRVLP